MEHHRTGCGDSGSRHGSDSFCHHAHGDIVTSAAFSTDLSLDHHHQPATHQLFTLNFDLDAVQTNSERVG